MCIRDRLGGAVKGYVILDRDCSSEDERVQRRQKLLATGLHVHIWHRRELESYLVHPSTIARLANANEALVEEILDEELEKLKPGIEIAVAAERLQNPSNPRLHKITIMEAAKQEVEETWHDLESKLTFCPAKKLLSAVNRCLQVHGHKTVSPRALSIHLASEEVPLEMTSVLFQVEELIEATF